MGSTMHFQFLYEKTSKDSNIGSSFEDLVETKKKLVRSFWLLHKSIIMNSILISYME